eukprot:CAMPEP_0206233774 /NCGR_PEP_ID=MMETSP0047_2-20121206/12203_1 /ASSEMBLY_ACC=CAM_ASM_000192 /TAXON_ID=195065 /ORGANISM="Chroomonas mesostigmatica_cf, Strain CCMP1168" /LENGTH=550 /DNA_ID=CAMNT_0053657749 /DNA_START=125 /DNA_END=1774 /DNA_ORIENTATION=-
MSARREPSASKDPKIENVVEHVASILTKISEECDFSYAEALHPRPDGHCLVQSGAKYTRDAQAERFCRASREFVFPLQIGIPGRVWKYKCVAKHGDVSVLPSTIYLRTELAKQAGLRGCIAIPLQIANTAHFFVALFYSSRILTSEGISDTVLSHARALLGHVPDCPLVIPSAVTDGGGANSKGHLAKSRSWLKCEIALQKPLSQRGYEDVDDIMKFTRRLEFFKHMPEPQRQTLCRNMTIAHIDAGRVIHTSNTHTDKRLWRVVIQGRMAVQVIERNFGNTPFPVWHFDEGQTFAQSYLNLFADEGIGLYAQIESVMRTMCLEISIPDGMEGDFKAWTRPLWYEELTRYFGVSINEAGEALGMCTSAIKKICRRHGIARWPHRKIASVEKTILTLQCKIDEMELAPAKDATALSLLRTDLFDAIRQKMQCGPNSRSMVKQEVVQGGPLEAIDEFLDDDGEGEEQGGRASETLMENTVRSVSVDSCNTTSSNDQQETPNSQEPPSEAPIYTGDHPVEFGIMQHQLAVEYDTTGSSPDSFSNSGSSVAQSP